LSVARIPAAKVRSAVKRRKPIRFANAGADALIVVGVRMEGRGLRRRRRILGGPQQWNHRDQKSRANALEQSTFEASPDGWSRCRGRTRVLHGPQIFLLTLTFATPLKRDGSAKFGRSCEIQSCFAAIERDFAA
jgi:hypothetical protein